MSAPPAGSPPPSPTPPPSTPPPATAWAPLRHATFRMLWGDVADGEYVHVDERRRRRLAHDLAPPRNR